MTVPARLTAVTLGCRDLPAQRRFYRSLGFPEGSASSDEWAVFRLAGVYLCLWSIEQLGAEAAPGEAAPTGWNGITLAINVATREEVDEAYAAAVAAGATPLDPPSDRPYGPRASYVADPEGNRWEIVWAPGTTIDEHDLLDGLGGE
jgi:catechol 2,3-dioxygenase-like lactoylglutathione lyase family enzyme